MPENCAQDTLSTAQLEHGTSCASRRRCQWRERPGTCDVVALMVYEAGRLCQDRVHAEYLVRIDLYIYQGNPSTALQSVRIW